MKTPNYFVTIRVSVEEVLTCVYDSTEFQKDRVLLRRKWKKNKN